MTVEHLRVLLSCDEDCRHLAHAAHLLTTAAIPAPILPAIRLGRLVALQKPNGRVRGLVLGDVFRRLVARTLAQQFSPQFQVATAPHQFALSTRAGGEALTRAVRVATEIEPSLCVLSVDGVGAYDHVARQAILHGLQRDAGLHPLLPFVRQFYSTPSEYIWYDASGTAHRMLQHEGGEQGDPLLPGLFAAAVAPALHQTHQALQPGEAVLAYLDDVYLLCPAARTRPLYERLQQALQQEANVSLNHGKTRIWNADGTPPPGWPEPAPNTPPFGLVTGPSPWSSKGSSFLARPSARTSISRPTCQLSARTTTDCLPPSQQPPPSRQPS